MVGTGAVVVVVSSSSVVTGAAAGWESLPSSAFTPATSPTSITRATTPATARRRAKFGRRPASRSGPVPGALGGVGGEVDTDR